MAFRDHSDQQIPIALLQRSLSRGRLGQAYLLAGEQIDLLEVMAMNLAKTLNCLEPPVRGESGLALDCCDACLNCRRISAGNHPDVFWVRPESKLRIIRIEDVRELMRAIHLMPAEATGKTAVLVSVDRLKLEAANAFLKTLEEPPPDSRFILLTTNADQVLETIASRCLRLNFFSSIQALDPEEFAWLREFSAQAAQPGKSLLSRYHLLGKLLEKLGQLRKSVEAAVTARSPLQRYEDPDPKLRAKWEEELEAAIEAEYKRQRALLLLLVERWLRDIWIAAETQETALLIFPDLAANTRAVAARLKPAEARQNIDSIEKTQRILNTNVQESLALEIGMLRLKF